MTKRGPKPDWLKIQLPKGKNYKQIKGMTTNLNTVCHESNCPNLGECWNSGTATFMLLGQTCTRACRFCSVQTEARPAPPDPMEPQRLVENLKDLNLKYLVLTTVDRDDLPDQGAGHIADCLHELKSAYPDLLLEILMPDFQGQLELLRLIVEEEPLVMGHNLECVRRITPWVRDRRADYDQSLKVLQELKRLRPEGYTKSSLLLGLGESKEEILQAMRDLREVGVDFLTLGQYLQPTKTKLPVERYLTPAEFDELRLLGLEMGFGYVASGPLVRSSYKAFEYFLADRHGASR